MYAGHFAAALALKTTKPAAPTWALVAGAGLMDLVFGTLVAARIEGFTPDFKTFHLLSIPWSHSLAMAVVMGVVSAAIFWRRGAGVVIVLFAAVLSHWVLDILVHRPDMELWPHSSIKLGFFTVFGPVSGWAETVIVLACAALYANKARKAESYGRHWRAVCGLLGVFWLMGLSAG